MTGSVNKAIIVGNLGRDPEIRQTGTELPVANLSVATSDTWNDRSTSERRERTEWHRVTVFGEGLARIVDIYLRKGSKVYLEGKLQTRKWADSNGNDRYTTEIVLQPFNGAIQLLDRRGDNDGGYGSRDDRSHGRQDSRGDDGYRLGSGRDDRSGGYRRGAYDYGDDDDIPF